MFRSCNNEFNNSYHGKEISNIKESIRQSLCRHNTFCLAVMESRDLVSVSRLVSRHIFASLGLESFRCSLGLEGFRSRDFEDCKELVYWNFYNPNIFCLLYLQVRNSHKMSENARNLKNFKSEARASAETFPRGANWIFCSSFACCWRCNTNARSQNAFPSLHHNENAPCYAGA